MFPETGVQTPGLVPSIRNSFGSGLGSLILPLPGSAFSVLRAALHGWSSHVFLLPGERIRIPGSVFTLRYQMIITSLHCLCILEGGCFQWASCLSLGERGKDNEFAFPKCSGVIGDTKTVIKLVGDKIQSGDAEYIRTPQGWIMHMCTGNASLISHRSRVQSYTFPVS